MSRFFRNTKNPNNKLNTPTETGQESSDESQKKIIVKKDLEKIKWRDLKPKRGYRNGIYPKWSRLRGKVYKSASSTFSSSFIQSIDRIRVGMTANPVHPVKMTRSKSSPTVLPLRPPNGHDH